MAWGEDLKIEEKSQAGALKAPTIWGTRDRMEGNKDRER
jgi:hypothetical protein